jgi:hypothetical protein
VRGFLLSGREVWALESGEEARNLKGASDL